MPRKRCAVIPRMPAHMSRWLSWIHFQEYGAFETATQFSMNLNSAHFDTLGIIALCYALRMSWEKTIPLLDTAIAIRPLYVN